MQARRIEIGKRSLKSSLNTLGFLIKGKPSRPKEKALLLRTQVESMALSFLSIMNLSFAILQQCVGTFSSFFPGVLFCNVKFPCAYNEF